MVDFWLTLGAMIADPKLLDGIQVFPFKLVPTLLIEEEPNQPRREIRIGGAGHLPESETQQFRDQLEAELKARYQDLRIPVSLYAAGKIGQLLNVHGKPLTHALHEAHDALLRAAQSHNVTLPLPVPATSLIGASLIDQTLSSTLATAGGRFIADRFGVDRTGPEWLVLNSWLADSRFISFQEEVLRAPTWDRGCREVFFSYAGFLRAVN